MWCNQIFSLIDGEGTIQNIIVADNYEVANQLSRQFYGENAYSVDTTHYPVSIGYKYIGGKFFEEDGVVEIARNPTETEKIIKLETRQIESELKTDFRLSLIELGLV